MTSLSPDWLHQWRWLVALLLLGLAGCAYKDAAVGWSLTPPPPFSESGEVPVPDRWWTAFDDSDLNRQVDCALDGNYTLAAALQRLQAARALTRREASDLLPDVNFFKEAAGTIRSNGPETNRFELGLDAAYEVDLWGRIESRVEAERLRASATEADYQAVALVLTAEIARTWYALIEARAQMTLLQQQLTTNVTGVKLQEAGFGGAGREEVNPADVLRQRQLVESTREQMVIVQARVDPLGHQLAVLQGQPPQGVRFETGVELPNLPPLPATGLPSELLHRRPDVQRDFLALSAADNDLASAVSAQYPRFNLTGSLSTVAENPENLFRDWVLTALAQIIAPLFDGGQRAAEVDRNAAVLRELIAQYGQTVLIAYREVEDALALEEQQRKRIENLKKQLVFAQQASEILRQQYFFEEDADYLDVLTSITQEQQLQRDILSARLDLTLTRINLYLALAGSFDTYPPIFLDDCPPIIAESPRSDESAILTPVAAGADFGDRMLMHSRRDSSGDRGDQSDRADRTADRSDPEIGGAR